MVFIIKFLMSINYYGRSVLNNEIEHCKCRIPSPSQYHENCLNKGCEKRIKPLHEKYTELKEKYDKLVNKLKEYEKDEYLLKRTYNCGCCSDGVYINELLEEVGIGND